MKIKFKLFVLLLLVGFLPIGEYSFAGTDKTGSKDHPLLKRMDGSWIYDYEYTELERLW